MILSYNNNYDQICGNMLYGDTIAWAPFLASLAIFAQNLENKENNLIHRIGDK